MRQRGARVAALILGAVSLWLHVQLLRAGGPLWRDEITTLHVASSPTWSALTRAMEFDSFPILPFVVVRGWTSCFGRSDAALRALGLVIGAMVLAALWLAARAMGLAAPLLSTALIGMSGAAVRYGDSLRGYGLGMLMAVITVGAVHAAMRGRAVVPALLVILAVHATFYNALVVFACCAGAVAVALLRRQWRSAAKIIAIGALAGATLLPYLPLLAKRGRWESFAQYAVDPLWVWKKFSDALLLSGAAGVSLWIGLLFAAAAAGLIIATRAEFRQDEGRDTAIYLLVALVALTVVYAIFLLRLRYLLQPWYFVVFLAAAALCIDGLFAPLQRLRYGAAAAALVAAIAAAAAFPAAQRAASLRFTSMDRAAAVIARAAAPGDLVIVYPWYCGVSFARYARRDDWMTLPPIPDQSVQRYDLAPGAPAEPLIARVGPALAGGHTVWLAGFPLFEESGAYLDRPERARGAAADDLRWCAQLVAALRANGARGRVVLPRDPAVSEYENAMVVAFR